MEGPHRNLYSKPQYKKNNSNMPKIRVYRKKVVKSPNLIEIKEKKNQKQKERPQKGPN